MKSRDYEYVLAISQEGSFSRAAQRLYITQPALSSAIKKLEQELYGVPLFDRSASPVKLTPEGQFWLEKARQISALDNEIDEHFSSISGVLKGTISVGSSSYFCAYVLAGIIHRFQDGLYAGAGIGGRRKGIIGLQAVGGRIRVGFPSIAQQGKAVPPGRFGNEEHAHIPAVPHGRSVRQ